MSLFHFPLGQLKRLINSVISNSVRGCVPACLPNGLLLPLFHHLSIVFHPIPLSPCVPEDVIRSVGGPGGKSLVLLLVCPQ